jgi:mono/diheme cytochrome c family protein
MTARTSGALLLMVAALAVAPSAESRARERDANWTAPASAALKPNPLAERPETIAGGRKLFAQRCASCHGEGAAGTDKAPDLTDPAVQAESDGALFWKISTGNTRAGMPDFSYLPAPQRWQIVLHLRTLAVVSRE